MKDLLHRTQEIVKLIDPDDWDDVVALLVLVGGMIARRSADNRPAYREKLLEGAIKILSHATRISTPGMFVQDPK